MENTYNNEREIDLKALFFSVLHRWRSMILCGLILCVLLGGYRAVKEFSSQTDSEAEESLEDLEKDREKTIKQKRQSLENYKKEIEPYEKSIESLKDEIDNRESYMEDSMLMNLDAYNVPTARANILVKMKDMDWTADMDQMMIDPTDALLELYRVSASTEMDWKALKKIAGVSEDKYVKELISVSASSGSNTLNVYVTHSDQETAEALLDEVLGQIEEKQTQIEESFGAHTLTVYDRTSGVGIDTSLADRQKQNRDNIINYNTNLFDRQTALNGIEDQIEALEDELEDLEEEEPILTSGVSRGQVLKQGLKFAILGGAAGVFLMAFFWGMIYLLSGRLHGEPDMKDALGIDVLGSYDMQVKKRPLSAVDAWLGTLEGKNRSITKEKVVERVVIQLRPVLEKGSKFLITGTVPESTLQEFRDQFAKYFPEVEIMIGSDLNHSVATLDLLAESDKVLIIEQREKSLFAEVAQEQEMIRSLAKPIVGCVLV